MFRIDSVGKLVLIHVTSLASTEEIGSFQAEVMHAVNERPVKAHVVVDLRTPRIFAPDVATALEEMLKRANPKIQRSAILLAKEHAVFSLQLERIIREARNPARRSFRSTEELSEWLHEHLNAREADQLDAFLRER
jgi:hypothetical protein